MSNEVPLCFYKENGERVVVGSVKIENGQFTGTITDTELGKLVSGLPYGSYSICPEPVDPSAWIDNTIHEVDRCARAYGFEIGRGHVLAAEIKDLSSDNPFLDHNWRSKIKE